MNIKSEQNKALHNWGFCRTVIIDAEDTVKNADCKPKAKKKDKPEETTEEGVSNKK